MEGGERVGLLILRAHTTGDQSLRIRATWLRRLDDPGSEQTTHLSARADVHALVDRWLDGVQHADDDVDGTDPTLL